MRDLIKLVSTGKTQAGKITGIIKVTTKNKKLSTEKIKKKFYDRRAYNPETGKCGMHVLFEEAKI